MYDILGRQSAFVYSNYHKLANVSLNQGGKIVKVNTEHL